MYKVTVTNKEGKIIRTKHFSTKKKAEQYEEDNTFRNPVGWMMDFKIEKVEGD